MHRQAKPQQTEVIFSPWTPWAARTQLQHITVPGVYLLAHFDSPPVGPASPRAREVIYIGETCATLRGRWRQFYRSAFKGERGHSGGTTYRRLFSGQGDNLFVAAFPVQELEEEVRPFFIRHVERKLLWDYVQQWNEPPKCNRK